MLVVFDVIGTLFSPQKAREAMKGQRVPEELLDLWLARLFHASFALALTGRYVPYRPLAESTLKQVCALKGVELADASEVVGALRRLDPWDQAAPAVQALHDEHTLVALSNGSQDATESLLQNSGLARWFASIHSSDAVQAPKPDARPYRLVLDRYETPPSEAVLVAAHGWDIAGGDAVGMQTIYSEHLEGRWPMDGDPPGATVEGLKEVPQALRRLERDLSPGAS